MRAWMVVSVFLVVAFAGCLGGDDDPDASETGTGPSGPTEDTGVLNGTVVNQETFGPIADAHVRLIKDEQERYAARTDLSGSYQISGIEPSRYVVQVSSLVTKGDVDQVTIEAGKVTEKDFLLEPLTNVTDRTPRSEQGEFRGYFSCTVNATSPPGAISPCSSQDPNHKLTGTDSPDAGLRTLTVGLVWTPAPVGAEELTLRVRNNVDSPYDYGEKTGTSPLEIRIDASDLSDAPPARQFEHYDDGEKSLGLEYAVRPAGVGVLYNQEFEVYYTYHYWREAPPGHSAIPDA